jgi:hypothetical protein
MYPIMSIERSSVKLIFILFTHLQFEEYMYTLDSRILRSCVSNKSFFLQRRMGMSISSNIIIRFSFSRIVWDMAQK